MKVLLRYAFVLLALNYGAATNAQSTALELTNMRRINATQWEYGTVRCTSGNNITSIILSMYNNEVTLKTGGGSIQPTRTVPSLGYEPRTYLYLFTPALTPAQVNTFIEGMTFTQNNLVPTENPSVKISVDANPTSLPGAGSTITAWNEHPDGTPHYYVWVPEPSIYYEKAYNDAKKYYFQGMRGYLPTITSLDENLKLKEISLEEGWSGGARTPDNTDDKKTIDRPTRNNTTGADYKWLCGPETGFFYQRGPTYSAGGAMNGAFVAWNTNEPNDSSQAENVMQVNYNAPRLWNDYSPTNANIRGYFIEFGGTGLPYSVGSADYPANDKYNEKKVSPNGEVVSNDQWEGFSTGNRASTSTTFKPNVMRSNVLVID